jgi:hypothetical protein
MLFKLAGNLQSFNGWLASPMALPSKDELKTIFFNDSGKTQFSIGLSKRPSNRINWSLFGHFIFSIG